MKIGYLIYTFNRVEDACIQMEIVRKLWEPVFGSIYLVNCFNGKKEWCPKKYLEDKLIRFTSNPGHYRGAAEMIDRGVAELMKKNFDYIVVSAADTWIVKPELILKKIEKMRDGEKVLLSSPWGTPTRNDLRDVGMSADFFAFDAKWAKTNRMFPVKYHEFYQKNIEILRYRGGINISYEKLLFSKYMFACEREIGIGKNGQLVNEVKSKVMLFEERMPIHYDENWNRTAQWPELGLYTDHEAKPKQKVLKKLKLGWIGEHATKLTESKDLSYFIK